MKAAILILILAFTVSAQTKQKPVRWVGLFVGGAVVSPVTKGPFTKDSISVEVNAVWSIKRHWNFQLELIVPVNGNQPLYRVAVARRIF